jgi:cation-transporting ATPase 13A1
MAGKLDACLFDKTGTLTTDELVPVGVMNSATVSTDHTSSSSSASKASPARKDGVKKDDAESRLLMPMSKLSHEAAALVLAGCHSLILIDGETTGDPLESAALKAMRWEVAAKSGNVVPSPATEKKLAGLPLSVAGSSSCSEIKILSRHHFSSKLQRMSCVVKDVANRRHYSVVKGSPEMIGTLLQTKPKGYDKAAQLLSRRGYRVISLAFKPLSNQADVDAAKDARSVCEDNLSFAGFVAFTCRVRRDTKMVLSKLKEGGMSVAMVTGDALLTAIHVAKEVNICDSEDAEDDGPLLFGTETNRELQELLESKRAQNPKSAPSQAEKLKKSELKSILILEQDDTAHMYWQRYDDDSAGPSYAASEVPEL